MAATIEGANTESVVAAILMSEVGTARTPQKQHIDLEMDAIASVPELMTEAELIEFLRIPIVSKAANYSHVVEHLKRMRGLPCIHIGRQPLYPVSAIRAWIQREVERKAGR